MVLCRCAVVAASLCCCVVVELCCCVGVVLCGVCVCERFLFI